MDLAKEVLGYAAAAVAVFAIVIIGLLLWMLMVMATMIDAFFQRGVK